MTSTLGTHKQSSCTPPKGTEKRNQNFIKLLGSKTKDANEGELGKIHKAIKKETRVKMEDSKRKGGGETKGEKVPIPKKKNRKEKGVQGFHQ